MNRLLVGCLLSTVGLALSASPAPAAAVYIESLEWTINDSDLVVRGTLTEVKRVMDKKEIIWSTITVKVTDTYKGEKKDELKVMAAHKNRRLSDQLAALANDKPEVILCLVKSDRYKAKGADYTEAPWAVRLHEGEIDHAVIDLSDKSNALVVSMDSRLLGRDDIVKVAQAAGAAAAPTVNKPGRLLAPRTSAVAEKLTEGGAVWLYAPVDKRLEALAGEWLKSKDIDYRSAGVKALWNFKTDDHIRQLKALLEDPQSQSDGKTKTYPVRRAAHDVLTEWGIDVKAPVTQEPDR
jgi:hypothetical protein